MAKQPKLGSGKRFSNLTKKLGAKGANNPAALAASIGRKKYGNKKFAALGAGVKKKGDAHSQGAPASDTRTSVRFGPLKTNHVAVSPSQKLKSAMRKVAKAGK